MKKIILDRGKGKTTELIKMSAETGDYIVVGSLDECSFVSDMARKLGYNIPFPISYQEFVNKQYHAKGIKGFLIDNVERLVQYMSNVPVNAITLNP